MLVVCEARDFFFVYMREMPLKLMECSSLSRSFRLVKKNYILENTLDLVKMLKQRVSALHKENSFNAYDAYNVKTYVPNIHPQYINTCSST